MAPKYDLQEIGATGLRRAGGFIYEEFLTNLRGPLGRKAYREMADNDPVIGSILYAIEQVIVRLDWRVDAYKEDGEEEATEADKEVAEFVESCFYDMSETFDNTLRSILSMLPFGWSYHELVYKKRVGPDEKDSRRRSKHTDGKIGWRKWPIRSQESLIRWQFDDEGGIEAMIQFDPVSGMHTIPIEKALLFRTTQTKNNPEGRSLLRNSYRPWFFKKRIEEIEAIGIERDLAGLPVAYVPPEMLSSDATAAQKSVLAEVTQIVQNIKRNEQEGVIFPAAYDDSGKPLFDLKLLSTGGQRQFDTDKIISRYDQRIAMSVLSDFILLGHERVGSFALGTAKMDLWSMAVDAIARNIAETINTHAIPRLMRLNGLDTSRMPSLNYSEVGHVDLAEISDYISKLANAGILVSDPNLEDYLRDLAGLPPAEHNEMTTGGLMPQQLPNGLDQMQGIQSPNTQQPAAANSNDVEEPESEDEGTDNKVEAKAKKK